jgi:hypothetical protein
MPLTYQFGDTKSVGTQSAAGSNIYIQVNPDQADHMLVDPAHRMEKMKEAHEKLYAMHQAYREVDRQLETLVPRVPALYGKDLYESWWNVEMAIRKYDRWFNKVEKFDSRAFIDPENHERRERRMTERKNKRWLDHYTYFFGGLSEEEQMYRDYFQTDLEEYPEDEAIEEKMDEMSLASTGEFAFQNFDFMDLEYDHDATETIEDVVDKKIFKYKYRIANDSEDTYFRRQNRVVQRSLERAQNRDPAVETDLNQLFMDNEYHANMGQFILNLVDGKETENIAAKGTEAIRKYMLDEAEQQYRDYYESDEEEHEFFEFMSTMSQRDKIRFVEIFEDFTRNTTDGKTFKSIPKREHNPELSVFQNLALDLIDFRDRVKPLAEDMARLDQTHKYQSHDASEMLGSYQAERQLRAAGGPKQVESPQARVEEPEEEEPEVI